MFEDRLDRFSLNIQGKRKIKSLLSEGKSVKCTLLQSLPFNLWLVMTLIGQFDFPFLYFESMLLKFIINTSIYFNRNFCGLFSRKKMLINVYFEMDPTGIEKFKVFNDYHGNNCDISDPSFRIFVSYPSVICQDTLIHHISQGKSFIYNSLTTL